MSAYYNEYNRHAAATLRQLMRKGLIAQGVVDERPIQLVQPSDLRGFTQHHFFAGIGGWSRGCRLAGWPDDKPVCTVSCPCQSFSDAGAGRGFDDERHLWPEFFRLVVGYRFATIFGEQVEAAVRRGQGVESWLDLVRSDLVGKAGYDFGAAVFPAAFVGAPHLRERLYFVADSDGIRHPPACRPLRDGLVGGFWAGADWVKCPDGKRRASKPGLRPVVDGLPGGMDALRGAGNAIVPQQAAEFIMTAAEAIESRA
jgi:DNA (cytosine-5)-methyltransferase 1